MDHTKYKCLCNRQPCHFCDGGLFLCAVCNGAEGSLPTECPGVMMTTEQADAVYAAKLDFINGSWVKKDIK